MRLTSMLIVFFKRSEDFLSVIFTLSLKSFLYCSGVALQMFVLLANIIMLETEFILKISSFNYFWKSSIVFLNFRELAISKRSFSNVSNSFSDVSSSLILLWISWDLCSITLANQKDCGLCRDDGLLLLSNVNGHQIHRVRKNVIQLNVIQRHRFSHRCQN